MKSFTSRVFVLENENFVENSLPSVHSDVLKYWGAVSDASLFPLYVVSSFSPFPGVQSISAFKSASYDPVPGDSAS